MKIGIISDSHRFDSGIKKAVETFKKNNVEMIFHAGDHFRDTFRIKELIDVPIIGVAGNCDIENVEDEIVLELEGKKIFLTHGHKYGVKNSTERLEKLAKDKKYDIIIYGHTHILDIREKDDVLIINPGSTSMPKGKNKKTVVILDIKSSSLDYEVIVL